jgi:hypothetical protein
MLQTHRTPINQMEPAVVPDYDLVIKSPVIIIVTVRTLAI